MPFSGRAKAWQFRPGYAMLEGQVCSVDCLQLNQLNSTQQKFESKAKFDLLVEFVVLGSFEIGWLLFWWFYDEK